jgi:hypothetical protein
METLPTVAEKLAGDDPGTETLTPPTLTFTFETEPGPRTDTSVVILSEVPLGPKRTTVLAEYVVESVPPRAPRLTFLTVGLYEVELVDFAGEGLRTEVDPPSWTPS